MFTFRTSTEISADHRVVLTVPSEAPVGKADLVVTVVPQGVASASKGCLRRRFGIVHSGDARSADNDRIDVDLARAYGESHD